MATADEITDWLARKGRKALDLEAAKELAVESPLYWYVVSHGTKGYVIGKMTMQKFSTRHILVGENGQPVLFPTADAAAVFLRTELKIPNPHIFRY